MPAPDRPPASTEDDALLYGHDPAERIVALHPVGPSTMRLYRRESPDAVTTEDVRVHPFFFLSDLDLLAEPVGGRPGFPLERFRASELAGSGFFKYAVAFPDRGAYFDALRHIETATGTEKQRPDEVYLPGGPEQQYLMQTGRTLFKGMAFEDLKRFQLDIEVYSPEGFPQATVPEHRIILVALSDSTGWSRLVGAPGMDEADVLRETLALIKERDPDVIEGHNCLVPGSRVWTEAGPVAVERVGATCAYGSAGLQPIPPFVARPYSGTAVTLRTERGGVLTTTPDHPHLVATSETTAWTAADAVRVGDYVAGPRRLEVPPSEEPLSEADFYAAGLIWSDGHIPEYPNLVWFSNTDPALLDWMRGYMGPGRFEKHRQPAKPQHAPLSKICLSGHDLRERLAAIGVPRGNKLDVEVGFPRVLRAPAGHARAFLRGVIDGDGHVCPDGIMVATASPSFRAVLRHLAARFGLQSTETAVGVKLFATEDSYDDVDEITSGLVAPKKRVRADRSRALRDDLPPEVVSLLRPFFRGRGDKAAGVWGLDYADVPLPRTTVSYVLNGRTRLSRRIARVLIDAVDRHIDAAPAGRAADWRRARRQIDGLSQLSWYRVRQVDRTPYEGPVYNTTTPDHTYVVDGLLTHNCLGFDFPYLFERCRRHGVPVDIGRDGSTPRSFPSSMRFAERQLEFQAVEIAGRHVVDTLHQVMAFDVFKRDLPNYTLKGAAKYFGFAPEGRTYVPGDEIAHVWDTDPHRLMEYAVDDATETERLARHLSGSTFYLTQMVPMSYGQAARTGPAAKIESLFVRGYLHARHSLPRAEFGSQVVGGYTDVFVTGVVGPVVYADVESLYPSIMLHYDVQPKGDALGLFPRLLRRLTDLRFETKAAMSASAQGHDRAELDARQSAYKIVINCFAPDTEVLTADGPKPVGHVAPGDLVYAIDPVTLAPALRPVEATARQRYAGPMVEIVNRHVDFLVTPEHRFLTARFLPGGAFADYAWETAGDLLLDSVRRKLPPLAPLPQTAETPGTVSVADLCERHDIAHKTGPRGVKERRRQGRWQPGAFALDDWLAFLGWYVSEGTLCKSTPKVFPSGHARGEGYRVTLCQKRAEGRDEIRALLDRMGIAYGEDRNGFGFSSRVFYEVLEAECGRGSYEKHLPPWVFGLPADRLAVLFGTLMAGDGDASGKRYTTASRRLADDFVRLSLHLGRRSYVMSHDGAYRIAVNDPEASVPKGLAPVVKGEHRREVPYDGEVVCLSVADHHTVLAGRNGLFNWCGQSFYGNMGFGYALFNDFAEADRVASTGQDILRQIMRLARRAGATVIEVDTDGVLFIPPEDVVGEEAERAFVRQLSEQMPDGIRIGFDGRYERMLSYKKKNYALLSYDGTLKFKGSSLVSRSSERFGRAFVRGAIRLLLAEDVAGLHELYLRHRRQIEAHDWRGVESFQRTETLKASLADYDRAVAAGERTKAAAYEVARQEARRRGRPPRIGDRVSYYIAEGNRTASGPGRVFEAARAADHWRPEAPDESTAFYLDRLDQLTARLAPFFETERQFRLVFSEEDLFGFDPSGVRLVVTEREPDEVEDDVPF